MNEVLPAYAGNSLQATLFRHEAREIFRNALGASEDDACIFVGSGCTGAVHKLINGLNLTEPPIVSYLSNKIFSQIHIIR
jgi:selenocysteine lyase/cysteine desulfurase